MNEFGVPTPWQAFAQVRLRIYDKMLADPQVLVDHQWPHNLDLLHDVRRSKCRTGLATMSHCIQARRVLRVLNLTNEFDFVATRGRRRATQAASGDLFLGSARAAGAPR